MSGAHFQVIFISDKSMNHVGSDVQKTDYRIWSAHCYSKIECEHFVSIPGKCDIGQNVHLKFPVECLSSILGQNKRPSLFLRSKVKQKFFPHNWNLIKQPQVKEVRKCHWTATCKFQVNAWTSLKSIKYNFLRTKVHKQIQHWPFHYLKLLSGKAQKQGKLILSNAKSAFTSS